MMRKNKNEKYKPDYVINNKGYSKEDVDEKIIKEIERMSDDIKIPASLEPQNMMKKIDEAKKTDKRLMKKSRKFVDLKKRRFYRRAINSGVSAAVVLALLFTGIVYRNNFVEIEIDSTKVLTEDEEQETGKGTTKVLSASSREEVAGIISVSYMREYGRVKAAIDTEKENAKSSGTTGVDNLEEMEGESATGNDVNTGSSETSGYYKNNDQVQGVVEADYVVTDGKYIYAANYDNSVINIVSAENGTVRNVSKIDYEKDSGLFEKENYIFKSISKMFVKDNKVIVLFDYACHEKVDAYSEILSSYYDYGEDNQTIIMQYDMSDIENPVLEDKHIIDGSIISSRMTEGYVYVITSKKIKMEVSEDMSILEGIAKTNEECIPKIDGKEISYEDIYIAGENEDAYCYEMVSSFYIGDEKLSFEDSKAVLSRYGQVYVSNQNIYAMSEKVTVTKENDKNDGGGTTVTRTPVTRIYRFSYEKGKITPCAVGEVKGSVLNQFSADEHNGYLRVVSTISEWKTKEWDTTEELVRVDTTDENALYVLDENLNVCGSIGNIAKDERIYSARFMGDYGYFVTFRQTDPLYVVDLSNPKAPVILDELKVTGFSSYLHQWSENVLLGVGEEADEEGRQEGIKIALYDISDKANINEISEAKIVINNAYSMDTYEYKRMLVAPEKSLFGINVIEEYWNGREGDIIPWKYNLYKYEDGGFVNILEYGFEQKSMENESMLGEYRGLYIGDYVYIITLNQGIVSFNLNDYTLGEFVRFD